LKTIFYLVRHGETASNEAGLIQGQTDSPLTDKGKEQALDIKNELSHIHFDAAFSSDLGRAYKTAQIILAESNLEFNRSTLLRERNYGKFQSRHHDRLFKEKRELLEKLDAATKEERWDAKYEDDMESDKDVYERVASFIKNIAPEYKGKNVLIITHGGPMKVILIEKDYDEYAEIIKGNFDNTGYLKLTCDGSTIEIDEVVGFHRFSDLGNK